MCTERHLGMLSVMAHGVNIHWTSIMYNILPWCHTVYEAKDIVLTEMYGLVQTSTNTEALKQLEYYIRKPMNNNKRPMRRRQKPVQTVSAHPRLDHIHEVIRSAKVLLQMYELGYENETDFVDALLALNPEYKKDQQKIYDLHNFFSPLFGVAYVLPDVERTVKILQHARHN